MSKTSFDDYLSIVESGQEKTASQGSFGDNSILAKLAEELDATAPAAPAAVAPVAPVTEGQVAPAASTVAAANPAVLGQTEAVAATQVAMAGGNAEEAAAGEVAAPAIPNQVIAVSAGDGVVTDPNNLGKTPAAIAASTAGEPGAVAAPVEKTAAQIGEEIADAFLGSIVKQAEDGQYQESLVLLKEAGLLSGYSFDDSMSKVASQEEQEFYALDKIASLEELTRNDIIAAADELSKLAELDAMEKEAEDYGRQLARDHAQEEHNAAMAKEAELNEAYNEGLMAKEAADVNALMGDADVVAAVSVLKERGLI